MATLIDYMPGWLRNSWDGLALLLLGCCILYSRLDTPLLEPDESRYAEIPRLMVRSGDWITPKLQGKPYNDKPPLVYWLVAASYSLFGVGIEASRLVPATSGLLTLIIIYLWSRRYLGRQTANTTVLILLSMLGYVAMMRMLLLDGVLALLVIGSLLSGHHALAQRRHPGWWLISAIFCGLGVLAKGPVAIVLVTPCLFALRWLDRTTSPMRFLDALWYGAVVLAIAIPWYAIMLMTNEGFGSEHFFRHHLRRFLDPAHHERPFWYYGPALFLELLPWPVLLLAVGARWRTWSGTERFLVFFSVLCFVFFSVAKAKLPTYLLPMLPVMAVLFGRQLLFTFGTLENESRIRWSVQLTGLAMLLTVMLRSVGFYYALHEGNPAFDTFILACLVVLIGMLVFLIARRNSGIEKSLRLQWTMVMMLAIFSTLCMTHRAIPDYAQLVSITEPCKELIQFAEKERLPYVAHRNSWDAVSFMLNREELDVFSSRETAPFHAWMMRNPRCMVWMRDYESRIEAFTKSLPPGIEVEQSHDLGRVQAIILRQAIQTTGSQSP